MEKFAHLHCHTDASLRDGMGTTDNLLKTAKGLGFGALAMTDHGTLSNAVSFTIEANRIGVKPIMGLEGYINIDDSIGHITLLADGFRGWLSLVNLNNIAQSSNTRNPSFTLEELQRHSAGLLCLTGCIASPIHQMGFGDAYNVANKLKKTFGHRLFAELMFGGSLNGWKRPLRIANELNIRTVITNDVHFAKREDGAVHSILTKMKSGFDYESDHLYLKTRLQLFNAGMRVLENERLVNSGLDNAFMIAKKIGGVDLSATPHLPVLPVKMKSLSDLISSSERAIELRGTPKYKERLIHEMKVIESTGFSDYFRILNDIVSFAKGEGIKTGPGRGSGAGSLVLYLLGITDVDPIKHGLQFERFLNPDRLGMPDVDVDFESERREEVLDFASKRYGAIPIATFSRYSHKSLVRDLGKMFRFTKEQIDSAAEEGLKSDAFYDLCELEPQFEQAYDSFIGQIRHKGKHAGGVIMTDTAVVVPTERVGDKIAAGWAEGLRSELSYAGVVKFDLLGLSALSALRRMRETTGLLPDKIEEDNNPLKVFRSGKLNGIFQFSGSDGIRDLTMTLKPEKFEDLVAINALYRPGAIGSGAMEKYPEWKLKPPTVNLFLAPVLAPTYGAIIYQEQVMEIYRLAVGGTLAAADTARRLISKAKPDDPSWVEKIEAMRQNFLKGCKENLRSTDFEANKLWEDLLTHTKYSFNKSHATAYTMISWEMAWYKYYFTSDFYAAMLNTDSSQTQAYISEAIDFGIKIVTPHVNDGAGEWVPLDKNTIVMPLTTIKFLGINAANSMVSERKEFGNFKSIEDFMKRVPKKIVRGQARMGLLAMGCFDGLSGGLNESEIIKILGIRELDKYDSIYEKQMNFLGTVLPDKNLLDEFAELEGQGYTCGIIDSTDLRDSKYGAYMVYRLSPNGSFWSRDVKDLKKGRPLGVKTSEKSGKALKIKLI